jgi:hypothetical protein
MFYLRSFLKSDWGKRDSALNWKRKIIIHVFKILKQSIVFGLYCSQVYVLKAELQKMRNRQHNQRAWRRKGGKVYSKFDSTCFTNTFKILLIPFTLIFNQF